MENKTKTTKQSTQTTGQEATAADRRNTAMENKTKTTKQSTQTTGQEATAADRRNTAMENKTKTTKQSTQTTGQEATAADRRNKPMERRVNTGCGRPAGTERKIKGEYLREAGSMDGMEQILRAQSAILDSVLCYAEQIVNDSPEGVLRTTHSRHQTAYYLYRKDAGRGRVSYISKKKDQAFIQALAQKEYAQKLANAAGQKKKALERFLAGYFEVEIMDVYENLPEARRRLVIPYELSDDEFAAQWQQEKYISEFPVDSDFGLITERGEMVRSKSEKILADKLYSLGIPYHYEKPLHLDPYGKVHPDFTILNKRTRKVYYWEHFGMMDDPVYCGKAILKLESYEKNHIFQGENLIITYETGNHPLNAQTADRLIRRYLL